MSMMSSINAFAIRTAGSANAFTPVAISAYHARIGIQLRAEAINSIIFTMIWGGTQEAMDKAYDKYNFAVSLIQMGGLFADSTTNALGLIDSLSGFASTLVNYDRANNFLEAYRNLSSLLEAEMHEMIRMSDNLEWLRGNTPAIRKTIDKMNALVIEAISTHW